jgi:hypothetical protein
MFQLFNDFIGNVNLFISPLFKYDFIGILFGKTRYLRVVPFFNRYHDLPASLGFTSQGMAAPASSYLLTIRLFIIRHNTCHNSTPDNVIRHYKLNCDIQHKRNSALVPIAIILSVAYLINVLVLTVEPFL